MHIRSVRGNTSANSTPVIFVGSHRPKETLQMVSTKISQQVGLQFVLSLTLDYLRKTGIAKVKLKPQKTPTKHIVFFQTKCLSQPNRHRIEVSSKLNNTVNGARPKKSLTRFLTKSTAWPNLIVEEVHCVVVEFQGQGLEEGDIVRHDLLIWEIKLVHDYWVDVVVGQKVIWEGKMD